MEFGLAKMRRHLLKKQFATRQLIKWHENHVQDCNHHIKRIRGTKYENDMGYWQSQKNQHKKAIEKLHHFMRKPKLREEY
jgi:mannose-1-phosphate guanylyltransferase